MIATLLDEYSDNKLFKVPLDYSLYTNDIEVDDPTGRAFHGKETYKRLFSILRFFNDNVFSYVDLKFKIDHKKNERTINVRWSCKIAFK
jgi:hypothetical protein